MMLQVGGPLQVIQIENRLIRKDLNNEKSQRNHTGITDTVYLKR